MTTPRDTDLQNEVWKALNPMKCYAITPGTIAELIERHPTAVTSALRSMYGRCIVSKVRRKISGRVLRYANHFWRSGDLKCGQ